MEDNTMKKRKRTGGKYIPEGEVQNVIKLLEDGWFQHQIAALYGVNQGRVSEIKNRKYILG
jgi:hypothetical protein